MKKLISLMLALILTLSFGAVPSHADSSATEKLQTYAYGDVNADRVANAVDALKVLQHAVDKHPLWENQLVFADVSGDNAIDAKDALLILQKAVGKIDKFPAEPMSVYLQNQEILLKSMWAPYYSGEADDAQTAALYVNRLQAMNTAFNTKTTVEFIDPNSLTDTIAKNVLAGTEQADVVEASLVMARNLYRLGVTVNLLGAPLPERLLDNGATGSVTINRHVAGISLNTSHNIMGVVYNKNLIAQYAPDVDIPTLVTNKQWTFDAFRSLSAALTKDLDENGKTDLYGFTSNTNVIGMAITANVGGTALLKNGRVEASFCNQEGIDAMEWCKAMFKTDKSWLYKADINNSVTEFVNGRAGMFVSYAQFVPQIAQVADFELGFAPMPIGPYQTDYINGVYNTSVYVIPANKEKSVNKVCAWLEQMAPLEEEILALRAETWKALGMDDHSIGAYTSLSYNNSADYSSGVFSSSVLSEIDSSTTGMPVMKDWEKIKAKAQQEADDYYAPFYQ